MSNLLDNLTPRQNTGKSFLEKNQEQITLQNLAPATSQIKSEGKKTPRSLLKKIPTKLKARQLSFRLCDDLYNKVESLAKFNRVSMNKAIEHCLDQFFKNI